ncbi:LTA synthase family protein [uncultured Bacteroides sp.]|uniref:LTA synthase family protein n=1 Tax=uncultured Bacteroides sp. TaxID=162156 RepID=UPI00258AB395|nr:LTA synthase family protein [uncultured Bacteroides sp.]
MIDNLNGLFPCIWDSVHAKDVLVILPFFIYIGIYSYFYNIITRKVDWKCKVLVIGLIIGIVISSYWPNKKWLYDNPLYLYGVAQVKTFKEYGIVNFWIYQIYFYQGVSKEERKIAIDFMKKLPKNIDMEICDSVKARKNLILILVESMQSWPIELVVDGIEVTPNINALLHQNNSIYFPKEVPQVKDGRSSDAQLLINTGLLPLYMGATSGMCTHNTFPSLAAALNEKGYTTVSFICDEKDYWNQEVMSMAYHFEYLFDNIQKGFGRAKADEALFDTALSFLKGMKQPFYAQLVTLSTHSPYLRPLIESELEKATFKSEEIKYYLIAMQYVDYCIGKFIRQLKSEGLFDNSIVVITGDHEQTTFNQYVGREEMKAEDCFVPFIILNSPLTSQHTDKVIGQMDIYPSLLNLMGCCDYYFTGLGESVFNEQISDYAMYRSDIVVGGTNVSDSVKQSRQECWRISDILLRMDYFGNLTKKN